MALSLLNGRAMTHNSKRWIYVACAVAGLSFAGCATDDAEDLDPATTVGGDEMTDDGPLQQDAASDVDDVAVEVPADEVQTIESGRPLFQLPFPCGQVWAGQTRTNHSPPDAVDFNRANDYGDTVVAAAGGTVTRVANEGSVSYGRWIEIANGGGYRTRYAHLSAQYVHVGQVVHKGQKIGLVGNTGGSTGPHLHFEERLNGVAVRATFNGHTALYWGTKNYTSQNSCGTAANTVVGRVNTAGAPLTVRSGASSTTNDVGSVGDGASVTITCQMHGETIRGSYGTSSLWDRIGGGYIADAYVSTGSDGQVAPTCN